MSKEIAIADIAIMLKVDEAVVTRLFEEGKLSGFRWGNSWRTTEDILTQDIQILTDEARIESMSTERHRTRWDLTADERKSLTRSFVK